MFSHYFYVTQGSSERNPLGNHCRHIRYLANILNEEFWRGKFFLTGNLALLVDDSSINGPIKWRRYILHLFLFFE